MLANIETDNTNKAHVARARRSTRIASVSHGGLPWMAMAAGVVVRTVVLRLRPNEGDGGNGEGGDAQRGVNWGEGGGGAVVAMVASAFGICGRRRDLGPAYCQGWVLLVELHSQSMSSAELWTTTAPYIRNRRGRVRGCKAV